MPDAAGKNRVSSRTGRSASGPAGDEVKACPRSVENGTVGIGVIGLIKAICYSNASFMTESVLSNESQHEPVIALLHKPCVRRFEPRSRLPDP